MTVEELIKAVENLPTDREELDKLADEITAAYEKIRDDAGEDPTDEQLDQIEALADAMTKVKAARSDMDEKESSEAAVAEDRRARAAAAAEAFAVEENEEPEMSEAEALAEAEDATGDEFAAEESTNAEDTEEDTEKVPAEDPEEDEDEDTNTDGDEDVADKKDKELSVSKRRYAGNARGTEPAVPTAESPFTLDAAAPGYHPGAATLIDLAKSFNSVASGRSLVGRGDGVTTTAQFGHIDRGFADELVGNDEQSLAEAIDFATDESRLDGESLVAAGGWCAPSETIYDFLPTAAATGLFSLPEIGINRGGLRFPVDPDFSALYDATKYHMSEADAIAGKTKECIEIPCTDMKEVRLDVLWTCVTGNLLSNKGWPELTAKFLAEATKGHLHRLSAARLAAVRALSEAVTPGIPTLGTIGTVLNAVEIHVEDLRLKYRLGAATIEGVAPAWLKAVLRADLAYRDRVLPENVTDQVLEAHFATRGVRFQYVDDYQTDIIGSGATGLKYPEAVEVILYPAGTFFSSVENVINLGATYDSAGLSKNQRTEMFLEDGYAVGKRAYESRLLTIPVDVNGQTGLRAAVKAAGDGQGEG